MGTFFWCLFDGAVLSNIDGGTKVHAREINNKLVVYDMETRKSFMIWRRGKGTHFTSSYPLHYYSCIPINIQAPLRKRPNFVRHEKKWMRRKRLKMERRYLRLQEGVYELKAYIKFKQDNKPDY